MELASYEKVSVILIRIAQKVNHVSDIIDALRL